MSRIEFDTASFGKALAEILERAAIQGSGTMATSNREVVEEFLAACCEQGPGAEVTAAHLYAVFTAWVTAKAKDDDRRVRELHADPCPWYDVLSATRFGRHMAELGFRRKKANTIRWLNLATVKRPEDFAERPKISAARPGPHMLPLVIGHGQHAVIAGGELRIVSDAELIELVDEQQKNAPYLFAKIRDIAEASLRGSPERAVPLHVQAEPGPRVTAAGNDLAEELQQLGEDFGCAAGTNRVWWLRAQLESLRGYQDAYKSKLTPLAAVNMLLTEFQRGKRSTPGARRIMKAAATLAVAGGSLISLLERLDYCDETGRPYIGTERVW